MEEWRRREQYLHPPAFWMTVDPGWRHEMEISRRDCWGDQGMTESCLGPLEKI